MGVKNREEEEIRSQLIKAVEDNIDKFEWDEEGNSKLTYKDLVIVGKKKYAHTSFGHTNYIEVAIKYKNIMSSFKDDIGLFQRVVENIRNREEKKLKEQQEQDLKELKKLCKD